MNKKFAHIMMASAIIVNLSVGIGAETLAAPMDSATSVTLPEGMTQETYDRLCDNVLEYSEIPARCDNFSLLAKIKKETISGNTSALNDAANACTYTIRDLQSAIGDLEDDRNVADDPNVKNIYTQSIKMLTAQKSSMEDLRKTFTDAQSMTATMITNAGGFYANGRAITNGMQGAFIGYKTLEQYRNMYQKQVELYTSLLNMQKGMQAQGLATAYDVQSAQYDLNGAQLQVQSFDEQLRSLKQTMGQTMGYSQSEIATLTFGEMPGVDNSYMASRNLTQDIESAKVNNAAYGAARRMKSSDLFAKDKENFLTVQQINIAMTGLYDDAESAKLTYDAATTQLQIAKLQKDGAERKYALGMMGYPQYKGAEVQYIAAESLAQVSMIQAYQAVFSYQSGVDGILTLG